MLLVAMGHDVLRHAPEAFIDGKVMIQKLSTQRAGKDTTLILASIASRSRGACCIGKQKVRPVPLVRRKLFQIVQRTSDFVGIVRPVSTSIEHDDAGSSTIRSFYECVEACSGEAQASGRHRELGIDREEEAAAMTLDSMSGEIDQRQFRGLCRQLEVGKGDVDRRLVGIEGDRGREAAFTQRSRHTTGIVNGIGQCGVVVGVRADHECMTSIHDLGEPPHTGIHIDTCLPRRRHDVHPYQARPFIDIWRTAKSPTQSPSRGGFATEGSSPGRVDRRRGGERLAAAQPLDRSWSMAPDHLLAYRPPNGQPVCGRSIAREAGQASPGGTEHGGAEVFRRVPTCRSGLVSDRMLDAFVDRDADSAGVADYVTGSDPRSPLIAS
ncbi:hypothetical protein OXU80_27265 [Jeongeupella avenae]|uniref:Uncharacterized protein n=1 Tax=Antarcticirhabdus aurantiaca TaxID=2606717 RepID=A0ACD4NNF5_9HYPH|nr:hypothetical protein [Antarcticirhabdus aurantiaca]WAJ28465.1 hypothetical protein OXU80_27265 [Jeongeuplla avenae]